MVEPHQRVVQRTILGETTLTNTQVRQSATAKNNPLQTGRSLSETETRSMAMGLAATSRSMAENSHLPLLVTEST